MFDPDASTNPQSANPNAPIKPNAPTTPELPPLRIALAGYRSHPHVGGQGIYIRHLATALTQLGHKVEVISGPPYPVLPCHTPLITLPSLDLYNHPQPFYALKLEHLRSWADLYEWWSKITGAFGEPYSFGRRLRRYLEKNGDRYDVIHDNQSLCTGLLNIKQPLVETIHHPITRDREQAINSAKNWLHRYGAKRWYSFVAMQAKVARKLKHVVAVSACSRADIEHCFGRPIAQTQVIFNGIDTEQFKPTHEAKKAHQLLAVCSSDLPVKGVKCLLQAYAHVRQKHPAAQLKIIGNFALEGANLALAKQLDIVNHIELVTGLDDAAMATAYCQASVFVCASLYEGFGLPAAEAMSCGTAVVSSDGGALPEVIGDCGIVVPAGKPQALAVGIGYLLDNPELRQQLEARGRARALDVFSWQRVALAYVELYRQAIKDQETQR
ncbi:MAG: glycosyltransferase family 4 protein [Marinagarivorans sp.]|nr:glycosyltransferase family 4 protein [Marinagarivorans sp.]